MLTTLTLEGNISFMIASSELSEASDPSSCTSLEKLKVIHTNKNHYIQFAQFYSISYKRDTRERNPVLSLAEAAISTDRPA